MTILPSDMNSAAPWVVAALSTSLNLLQSNARLRADARAKAAEQETRDERTATAAVFKERQELATENKTLRVDLRTDIERLKKDIGEAREETTRARLLAAEWEQKYNNELNVNTNMKLDLETLRDDVQKLRNELAGKAAPWNGIDRRASGNR